MSSGEFPISLEKGLMSDELNSTILNVFLWGIYTVVYGGTLYLYGTKKPSRNQVIFWSISLSYLAYSTISILEWYRDQSAVVNQSETRDALFTALIIASPWIELVTLIMVFVMVAVADGILIWRCYQVCGHSIRAILFPVFLFFSEIVIDLAVVGLNIKYLDPVAESQVDLLNRLIAAQAFITSATTLASTTIIVYQLYSTTREIPSNSKRLLAHILEILVQSAAAYSLMAIAYAISGVVPQSVNGNEVSWVTATDYIENLFNFTAGVAPTVLVARVAILDENDIYASSAASIGAPSRLSGLRFHLRDTQDDAESQPQTSEKSRALMPQEREGDSCYLSLIQHELTLIIDIAVVKSMMFISALSSAPKARQDKVCVGTNKYEASHYFISLTLSPSCLTRLSCPQNQFLSQCRRRASASSSIRLLSWSSCGAYTLSSTQEQYTYIVSLNFSFNEYIALECNTLTLSVTRKSSRNQAILWTISISYCVYSASAILSWYRDHLGFVNHSETRDTLFVALWQGSQWPVFINDLLLFIMAAVADGILIWRCYHVCENSLIVILVPGFLLFCEIVIDLYILGIDAKHLNSLTDALDNLLNRLFSAQAFITFATTFTSTSLMARRIYTATRGNFGNSNQRPKRILEILVQSAAAYSLVAIAYAISNVVPQSASNEVSWAAATNFIAILFNFTSGVVPTVLVARIAILDKDDVYASGTANTSGPSRLSGLRFHVRTTQGDAESQAQMSDRINRVVEGQQVPEAEEEKGDIVNRTTIDLIILGSWGIDHLNPSVSQANVVNRLFAAQFFVTFATSLTSTILVAYSIYTTTRKIPGNSKRPLNRILDILVQSAAAYSLVAIAQAISAVVPQTNSNEVPWSTAADYASVLFPFISGVAPTILVARVAMLDGNDVYASSAAIANRLTPLSGLQFHVQTTQGDAESQDRLSHIEWNIEGRWDLKVKGIFEWGHRLRARYKAGHHLISPINPLSLDPLMSSGTFAASSEEGQIGDELNSTILQVFLWGIYTVVYAGTLYLYLTKKSSKNKVILWAISLSYWAYSALTIISWYLDQWAVVNHSETRDALFVALILESSWHIFTVDILSFILAAVADGILIWRCYHVWGHSFRAILIPGFLFFCEIVLDLVEVGVAGADRLKPSDHQENVLNRLLAAQAFATFATTLSSTTLIAYRIYTTTREIPGSSKRLLSRIVEILVQSAAAYSLVVIAWAISNVVPQTVSNEVSFEAAGDYSYTLFNFVSGVAPTVLVARVAILDENDVYASSAPAASGPSRLSGLRFHVRTTQGPGDVESHPQLSHRISRVDSSVEGPQVPKGEKEKGDIVDIP
ncbi:hypothetical protein CVT26_012929 [Gymnopilus dilepis]|uniref:Uncharacterized protein n=1 Tax=Gymnopilus dilepis TaxID=231916 RepID=A0A409Y4A8_9AGAR|nr:hypothetical protein CVT26_012929 [Gymnopilus dilepis]